MRYDSAEQNQSPGHRAAAYWFADDLPEIAFGIVLLATGLICTLVVMRGQAHRQDWWLRTLFLVAFPLFFFLHRRILDFFKARITYPRTGYVRPPVDFPSKNEGPDKIITLRTAVDENISSFRNHTVYLFFLGALFEGFLPARWSLPLVMSAIAAVVHFWSRSDARPYSWLSVLPIPVLGFLAAVANLEPMARGLSSLVIGGVWLFGLGAWTLVHYLRAHPRAEVGQEGHL